jgi:hypothetical protein
VLLAAFCVPGVFDGVEVRVLHPARQERAQAWHPARSGLPYPAAMPWPFPGIFQMFQDPTEAMQAMLRDLGNGVEGCKFSVVKELR